jgi:hypothetical protein
MQISHPNPFYRIANNLWLKQISSDRMEVDEALYHISVLVYVAQQEANAINKK